MQTHSKVRQLVEHKADRCEPGCLHHPGKINAETSQTAFREAERSCCGLLLLAQTPVRLRTAPPVVAVTSSVYHAKTVEEAVNQGVREETRHCSRHGRNFSWLDGMTIRNSVTADSRKDGTLEQSHSG